MEPTIATSKLTVNQFRNHYFDEDEPSHLYELLEGEMIQKSAPAPLHQDIFRNLFYAIETFNRANKLGIVYSAPIDVILDKHNLFQPDLLFIVESRRGIVTPDGIMGAPDIAVEIISPSSVMRDRIYKKRVYERCGVKEYWLVSPEYKEIEIFTLQNGKLEIASAASVTEGELQSSILKDLKLDLKLIFDGA